MQKGFKSTLSRRDKYLILLGIVCAGFMGLIVVLRIFGLLRPFYIPSDSMAPAVSRGDHVIAEGMTFLMRKPRRGDIVVFTSDGLKGLQPAAKYDSRIVGEPGEHLRISDGKLYINEALIGITNINGEVTYPIPDQMKPFFLNTNVTIPEDQYFLVGDNSTNSLDSRYWGCLPAKNIVGRLRFCYWPPARTGALK